MNTEVEINLTDIGQDQWKSGMPTTCADCGQKLTGSDDAPAIVIRNQYDGRIGFHFECASKRKKETGIMAGAE